MSSSLGDLVVCSFYTDDDYYRQSANRLRGNLDELGVSHVLREVRKEDGQDWADICRQKVAFLHQVCTENPEKRIFWSDVDCEILDFPQYLKTFSADLIGFQHGFATPMEIGYSSATRFWAPTFLGINTTPAARKFVADAARLERESTVKATDDYFFEESWRANAHLMNFQVIPAGAVLGRGDASVPAFFKFGSSGNVPHFRNKVEQHASPRAKSDSRAGGAEQGGATRRSLAARSAVRRRTYATLKWIEGGVIRLAPGQAERVHEWAKRQPLVHRVRPTTPPNAPTNRSRLLAQAISAGQQGKDDVLEDIVERLALGGILSTTEAATLEAAKSFGRYAAYGDRQEQPISLAWWPRPFPGNFGDWISPLAITRTAGRPVAYVPPTGEARKPHLVAVGSIARFVNESSIVVGTGASAETAEVHPGARYHSLRGPLTASLLKDRGGPAVESFGDPGVLLRRLLPIERTDSNGRMLLVRHFAHASLPVRLPEDMDEASVLRSSPDDLAALLAKMHEYDGVVTSAMHVMIACHSYGIPVTLVGFRGFEESVAGSGMKYRDYSLGASTEEMWEPTAVALDMSSIDFRSRLAREFVSEAKLDEVDSALRSAVADWHDTAA
ncbi:polysaccharide pyruvyl transferase family protein [Microbacterium sp. B2969]|uniref:Polysaccharide pyruvyl transferase family protein n=1 Tax=Microbacterium alkaliflavum TaxID=3248839 RepID=A0ABW7QBA0_9MICO